MNLLKAGQLPAGGGLHRPAIPRWQGGDLARSGRDHGTAGHDCGDLAGAAGKTEQGRLLGRFFAASRQRLRDVGQRLGLRRVPNLGGCPAS